MKIKSAKQLLTTMKLPLSAQSFFEGLRLAGMVETLEYESSTGSGEVKEFNRLGGINNQVQHPTGKVPRWASTMNNSRLKNEQRS